MENHRNTNSETTNHRIEYCETNHRKENCETNHTKENCENSRRRKLSESAESSKKRLKTVSTKFTTWCLVL